MSKDRRREQNLSLPFRFIMPIEVRLRDIDFLGHVNNAVYLTYFEMARAAYLATIWERPVRLEAVDHVIAEIGCQYRSAAHWGERLQIAVSATAVRSRSYELRYRITDEQSGRLIAEGYSVQVCVDRQSQRSTSFPTELRMHLERYEGHSLA